MPDEQDGLAPLASFIPENTLDFYKTQRATNGKKRNYIFDYGRSRSCDHVNLRSIARGSIVAYCPRSDAFQRMAMSCVNSSSELVGACTVAHGQFSI